MCDVPFTVHNVTNDIDNLIQFQIPRTSIKVHGFNHDPMFFAPIEIIINHSTNQPKFFV
jgi:hypothetical protein